MPWEMVLPEQSTVPWVSLESCGERWLSGIPVHYPFLPVPASPMALKKGAGGELGLLKEQDLERISVVSLVPKGESSESFQLLSEPLWLLRH